MSLKKELDSLGRRIIDDAKKYAAPNKDTGNLDRSLNYEVKIISMDSYTINLNEAYYGKYLNNRTEYMDKAIRRNIDRGIDDVVEEQISYILDNNNNNINN